MTDSYEGLNIGQRKMADLMAEHTLQEHVRATCKALRVLHWHHLRSKGTEPGWPDSFMVGPAGVLVRELKVQRATRGRLTKDQAEALEAMRTQGLDAGVWRPADWYAGVIQEEILRVSGRRKAL